MQSEEAPISPTNSISLGRSDLRISRIGVGTWAWGDRWIWGYGGTYGDTEIRDAFSVSRAANVNFFDTAEVYGGGKSERLLGELASNDPSCLIATKFMPFPWRMRRNALHRAFRSSLLRLGANHVALYQVHFPFPPVSIETWVGQIGELYQEGLVGAVGVSNYGVIQMQRAHAALARYGIPLASNQVRFSLLHKIPEQTGLLSVARDLGITVIAHTPLAQGLLTGKYSQETPPPGFRRFRNRAKRLITLSPLIAHLISVGQSHGAKSPAQVALNWVIAKGGVPIPGAKNRHQAEENCGAIDWSLTDEEVRQLDGISDGVVIRA